ncbi:SIMPL domain-containing protein [Croceicoccus ponticola]|uniref:SIMPL domain-containing protein n=1 Tax=Croceicoccus ponticola TaxID=2217664 RepID=UPI001F0C2F3F|nr:SIMPL domain-containing protein [Croceicoccus ponticola]
MKKITVLASTLLPLAACSAPEEDTRGVTHNETLLSVSASGEAESRPDEARFEAGINAWAKTASAASEAANGDIAQVVAALKALGIAQDDIQTRTVGVSRVDWGDRKGQYQASNVIAVTVRDVTKAGSAVTAVTEAGANVLSGPNLRISDPETAANSAYAAAYKAARKRAEAYADAAGMEISRVLYIRDAGGSQGNRYFQAAIPTAPPPPPVAPPAIAAYPRPESGIDTSAVMTGQTSSAVTVQVDFALVPK